jgi:hypothetical protein
MLRTMPLIATCLFLAACNHGSDQAAQTNDQAGALDNAAQQSDPAAAPVLRNEAEDLRGNGSEANLSDPNSPAQNALEAAGKAAASNSSTPSRQ